MTKPLAWRYSRNNGNTWFTTDIGDPTCIMPDKGGIVIPLYPGSPIEVVHENVAKEKKLSDRIAP